MHRRILYLVFICFLLVIGCNQKGDEDALPDQQSTDQFMRVENSSPDHKNHLNNNEIADHLANLAGDVPNVNDAVAIVAGPFAVVGIDVDADLDRSRVGTIKYSVGEALQHDPYGRTAVVIADGDIMDRIRLMGDKIQQGYPIQAIVEELAAIVGRYMPDVPPAHDSPTDPDQNKKIMDGIEEQRLEEIEREQSNEE